MRIMSDKIVSKEDMSTIINEVEDRLEKKAQRLLHLMTGSCIISVVALLVSIFS